MKLSRHGFASSALVVALLALSASPAWASPRSPWMPPVAVGGTKTILGIVAIVVVVAAVAVIWFFLRKR